MLTALWRYRHFILASILGEFKGRFARSKLGLFWSVLHPLAQAAIFSLVLAEVLGARISGIDDNAAYPIYLMAGLAAWSLFSEILNRCLTVFIDYAGALKKIAFPRICLPVIVWGGALLNHLLLLTAIAVVFLFFGHYPSSSWLALPFGVLLISMFAFGLGVILGVLNVYARDVGQVLSVVIQIWFWLTPIVYVRDIVPEHLRWLIDINPMAALVLIYQDALLFGRWIDRSALVVPTLLALALFVASFVVFRRASPELVDAL
jgi:lipopolysaccharide transport system permease protein